MGREFELKYRAQEVQFDTLRASVSGLTPIRMETTYFDTPDGALRARHWTLRTRLENGIAVCTVKTPAPNGGRGEWETECPDILQAIPELCKLGAPQELPALVQKGLLPVCGARFTRLAALIEAEGCTVELALDRGVLTGGGREMPLLEVEVELKEGSDEAAVAFAAALAERFGLQSEPNSKYRRALALAKGE